VGLCGGAEEGVVLILLLLLALLGWLKKGDGFTGAGELFQYSLAFERISLTC